MGIDLLTDRDHVLVAFDGPIAVLPPPEPSADRLRVLVAGSGLPPDVMRTEDPFAVIDHAATVGPATERAVHDQLCRIEHGWAAAASATPGVHDAFEAMSAAGIKITVVSGLSAGAVRSFLVLNDLMDHVRYLAARYRPEDRAVVPPAPVLVTTAIHASAIPAGASVFVGGTGTDLAAARAAGVATVSIVDEPGCWAAMGARVPRLPLRPQRPASAAG